VGSIKRATKLFLLAHKKFLKKPHKISLVAGIVLSLIAIISSLAPYYLNSERGEQTLGANISFVKKSTVQAFTKPLVEITEVPPSQTPTITPSPTSLPEVAPTKKPVAPTNTPTPPPTNPNQYTAQKIDDTTWRIDNVITDGSMASPQDIVNALNSYRGSHGRGNLQVDGFLSSYAQGRADKFAVSGLDGHADFQGFMNNDGFSQAGFNSLGENSAVISGPMNGDKIVRQIFGADPAHDGNQLDTWTHVGVGVNGNAINVNFGRGKR
jgi:uncharacterized protein YkwD